MTNEAFKAALDAAEADWVKTLVSNLAMGLASTGVTGETEEDLREHAKKGLALWDRARAVMEEIYQWKAVGK